MMNSSKKDKLKVLSADPVHYNCPRCGTRLSISFGVDFNEDFCKIKAFCPNDSFKTYLEVSKYGLIPKEYLQNIEKGILDRSEGWYKRWDLKETKNSWVLKPKK